MYIRDILPGKLYHTNDDRLVLVKQILSPNSHGETGEDRIAVSEFSDNPKKEVFTLLLKHFSHRARMPELVKFAWDCGYRNTTDVLFFAEENGILLNKATVEQGLSQIRTKIRNFPEPEPEPAAMEAEAEEAPAVAVATKIKKLDMVLEFAKQIGGLEELKRVVDLISDL